MKKTNDFLDIYNKHKRNIYKLVFNMLGNKDDADDLTQETFIQGYKKLDSFRGDSNIYTWLYRIAKNKCYRFLQKQKKGSFTFMESLIKSVNPEETKKVYCNPEKEYYIQQVKEGCLLGLLKCLSLNQRMAFILYVLLEINIKEIAIILEKTTIAARILIHRARKNIKTFLCNNCSLYDNNNPCRCENLIEFSIKQKWIQKSSKKDLSNYKINIKIVENEINSIKKIALLYKNLPEHKTFVSLNKKIKNLIKNNNFMIFSTQKVK